MTRSAPTPKRKPPTIGPRGGAGDSGAAGSLDSIMPESARAIPSGIVPLNSQGVPKRVGAMAESARKMHRIVTTRPGGIHGLLCRLGIHAWTQRYEGTHYVMHQLRDRCACGAVRRG